MNGRRASKQRGHFVKVKRLAAPRCKCAQSNRQGAQIDFLSHGSRVTFKAGTSKSKQTSLSPLSHSSPLSHLLVTPSNRHQSRCIIVEPTPRNRCHSWSIDSGPGHCSLEQTPSRTGCNQRHHLGRGALARYVCNIYHLYQGRLLIAMYPPHRPLALSP